MDQTGKVLVTGAFGNLGPMVLEELKKQACRVVATDIDTPHNRKAAARSPRLEELVRADRRTVDFVRLLQDCIAVEERGKEER